MDKVGEITLKVMKTASWYNTWLFSFISPYLGQSNLEVGSGIGNFTKLLSGHGQLTSIDLNRSYIKRLKEELGSEVAIGFGDIEKNKFFFKGKKFDTIVCMNVLEHIKGDKKALVNMNRLLKTGGKLLLLVPSHKLLFSRFDRKLGHFRRYSKDGLYRKLKNSGYSIIYIRSINWWAALGWLLFIKVMKVESLSEHELLIFDKLGKIFIWPERYLRLPFGLSLLAIAYKK